MTTTTTMNTKITMTITTIMTKNDHNSLFSHRHLVYPPRILYNHCFQSTGYYGRPKKNSKTMAIQFFFLGGGGGGRGMHKQGALWSMWKWWMTTKTTMTTMTRMNTRTTKKTTMTTKTTITDCTHFFKHGFHSLHFSNFPSLRFSSSCLILVLIAKE